MDDLQLWDAKAEAEAMGQCHRGEDRELLVQTAEYANDILPALRKLAGYEDNGHGTYTYEPDDVDPDTLGNDYTEIEEAFWTGVDG